MGYDGRVEECSDLGGLAVGDVADRRGTGRLVVGPSGASPQTSLPRLGTKIRNAKDFSGVALCLGTHPTLWVLF